MATKPAFAQGAQVEHQKFGLGSVVSCNDEYIVIKFDEHGEKKFISSMAIPNLKKSDRQPPVEKRATRARKKAAPAPAPAATTNAVES
jgi:transcription elongation factor GreA-like protein